MKKALIAIGIVVILGGMAWWGLQQRGIVSPPAEQMPSVDASNWETYRNERYGFEFQYPSNLPKLQEQDIPNSKRKVGSVFPFPRFQLSLGDSLMLSVDSRDCREPTQRNPIEQMNFFAGNEKPVNVEDYQFSVFTVGCYECYGASQEELNDRNLVAVLCNNNDATCLELRSKRVDESDYKPIKDLFIKQILPTFKIDNAVFEELGCLTDNSKG